MLLRPSDAKELCTLVTYEQVEGIDLALTPDGQTLYFSDYGLGACGSIFVVSIRGGRVRTFLSGGYAPTVSPDGRSLAYNASHSCGDRRHRFVVREIASGKEREWLGTWEGGYGNPTWAPDARFLVIAKAGSDSARHFLLDTRKDGPLDGKLWPPIDEDDPPTVNGTALSNPGVTLGGFALRPFKNAVAFGIFYSDEQAGEAHPILEMDLGSGKVRTLVKSGSSPHDFDPTGMHLLYRGLGTGYELFRLSDGRSISLGKGFYDAAW